MTTPFPLRHIEYDDHDNPAFLIRDSDSRVMAFYSPHSNTSLNRHYLQVSKNPLDPDDWQSPVDISSQLGSFTRLAYANAYQLTGETNDPIYLFFRADTDPPSLTPWEQYFSKSEDDGSTWAAGTLLVSGDHAYLKAAQNGDGRIDFLISDDHPDLNPSNVYHFYMQGGSFFDSAGNEITLPVDPATDLAPLWGGSGSAWNWEIAIDGSGNPVVVYAQFPSQSDHRYRYGKWNGSAWSDNEVAASGGAIGDGSEPHYSGGICIDPDDANIVYYSKEVSSVHQIFKGVTADGGANWTHSQLTSGGSNARFRPFKPKGASKLLFCEGPYATYLDYEGVNVVAISV